MPINLMCTQCRRVFSVRDEAAGQFVRCFCGQTLQIPKSPHSSQLQSDDMAAWLVQEATKASPAVPPSKAPPTVPPSKAPPTVPPLRSPPARKPPVESETFHPRSRPSPLLVLGTVGGILTFLVIFGLTVTWLINAGRNSKDNKDVRNISTQESPPSPDGRSNLLPVYDDSANRDTQPTDVPAHRISSTEAPPKVLLKSLATMDRLTIAVPPAAPDDAPAPDVWDGHTASIRGVACTDDGRFVVSVSGAIQKVGKKQDNSIRVWDARRGKQVQKLDNFREELDAVSVSPGGRFAVFGHGGHYEGDEWIDSLDHRVHLWDIQDNREVYFRKGIGVVEDAASDKAEPRFEGLESSVFSTAFSPDRKRVVGVDNSGKLVVWDTQTGQTLVSEKIEAVARPRTEEGLSSFTLKGLSCIRFTPDSRWLLSGGPDYTVRLFDVTTGKQFHDFESHQDVVWAVTTMKTNTGRLLGLSGGGSRQKVRSNGFVPGARDYAIRLWDLQTHEEVRRFVGSEGDVMSLVFCPNGRHFLSAGADKTVRLWDIDRGTLLRTYRGHTDFIRSVAVSPDGRVAVSGGDDCKIRYWRLPANVDDLVNALRMNDQAKVAEAMADIETMGPEVRNAYPQLIQALHQKDESIASLALTALRRIGQPDKEWVNDLRELLTDQSPAIRRFAAETLARLGADALPALPELRKALADTDPRVRHHAVVALGNLGKDAREAAEDLGGLVTRETDDEIKTEAVLALGKIDAKQTLKGLIRDVKEPFLLVAIMDALIVAGLDQSMVEPLTSKGLRNANAAVRSKALDCLRLIGLDTLSIKTLAELNLEDSNPEVRKRAAQVLSKRMDRLSDADMKDVLELLGMADKPKTFQIGLEAVKHRGAKAKEALPELLKIFPTAKGDDKVEMALALAAIDPKDRKIVEVISPVLVGALRPRTNEDKPSEAVLKAIAAIGQPIVDEIFKALGAADDIGVINANNRKALFLALERIGREAYSEGNLQLLQVYEKKERYRDVQEAAGKAVRAMLP